jgi:hypothetical protein
MRIQFPFSDVQVDSICRSRWEMVIATEPISDAILALAPLQGDHYDPARAADLLTAVSWEETPPPGRIMSGHIGDLDIGIVDHPVLGATFNWFRNGEPIPFDVEEALRVRSATLSMIACLSYGAAEGGRVYQVNAPDREPFILTVMFRGAAVASQSSDYQVTADYSGRPTTLDSLRQDGTEWASNCPPIGVR